MPIARVTARWTGFRGAPGYSNFFFAGASGLPGDADIATNAVRAFFADFAAFLPGSVSIAIEPVVTIIDEATGAITDEVDSTPLSAVEGIGGDNYSAASGAVVNWNTSIFRNGRRIRGRTFIVPLTADAYDAQGDLNTSCLSSLRGAADDLAGGLGSEQLVVWSRPTGGAPGESAAVTSATVPDLPAVLRSRRD